MIGITKMMMAGAGVDIDYYLKFETNVYAKRSPISALQPTSLPLSFETWIKFSNNDNMNWSQIYENDSNATTYHGIWLQKKNDNKISIAYGDGNGAASGNRRSRAGNTVLTCDGNTLYHIIMVIQGETNMQIYLNGVDDSGVYSGTGVAMSQPQNTDIRLAANSNNRTYKYSRAYFRRFSFWDIALTQADVTKLYNGGNLLDPRLPSSYDVDKTANLQLFLKINKGSGVSLYDSSGNGLTFTVQGDPTPNWIQA